jgi:hypothetical protein
MFDENSIATTTHPLARRLRKFFYRNNVTVEEFDLLIRAYGVKHGQSESSIRLHQINLPRALKIDDLTFRMFQFCLVQLFGSTDAQVNLVLQDRDPDTMMISNHTLMALIHGSEQYSDYLKLFIKARCDEAESLRELEKVKNAITEACSLLSVISFKN